VCRPSAILWQHQPQTALRNGRVGWSPRARGSLSACPRLIRASPSLQTTVLRRLCGRCRCVPHPSPSYNIHAHAYMHMHMPTAAAPPLMLPCRHVHASLMLSVSSRARVPAQNHPMQRNFTKSRSSRSLAPVRSSAALATSEGSVGSQPSELSTQTSAGRKDLDTMSASASAGDSGAGDSGGGDSGGDAT
jgi:hypothetical protein